MCGRFALDRTPEQLADEVEADWESLPAGIPSWNICPASKTAVLADNVLKSMTWGLIPGWSSGSQNSAAHINARIETADEKKSFKYLLGRGQCIIPGSGYFEWQIKGEVKIPTYIKRDDGKLLFMAGLWDIWISPEKEEIERFTILTRDAADSVSDVHSRMPVILDKHDAGLWTSGKMSLDNCFQKSLETLDYYEVSSEVNSVKNNHAGLIEPAEKPQLWQGELF